jgi:hypothetical protein
LLEVGDVDLKTVNFLAYRVKKSGVWQSGLVMPNDFAGPPFVGGPTASCDGCHDKAASGAMFTIAITHPR